MVEFFTNETDLAVADRLTLAISDLAKDDFHPRDFERIATWWQDHRDSYTNWPFAEFDHGYNTLNQDKYSEAVTSFEEVLKRDPSADMSRALVIGGYLQMGETNNAAQLAKAFKEPTARWAQWANALKDLQTGNASNATVRFVDLTKKHPTMLALPREDSPFWKKIDWQLFNKVIRTNAP